MEKCRLTVFRNECLKYKLILKNYFLIIRLETDR